MKPVLDSELFPLSMEVESIEVTANAGIFRLVDRSGVVERLRVCVREAMSDSRLRSLEQSLGLSPNALTTAVQIPDIIHSTFFRYPLQAPTAEDEEELKQGLEDLVKTWTPRTVQVQDTGLS